MNLLHTASLIVLLTLVGRLLGFFRNIYLSHLYGTGMVADAFTIASTIPFTLFLVVPGAINAVLIPPLRGLLEKGDHGRAQEIYQKVLTITLLFFFLLAAAGWIWAYEVTGLFGVTGEKAAITAEMLRWMWPSAVFIGLIGLWSSISNAHQHFFTPTLGTVANGAAVLVGIYLLVPVWGTAGLAIATTIGYLAAAVTILPTMRRFGYQHRFRGAWRQDELLQGMGERLVPILIGAAIAQLTTFLERGFASELGDGKIAALMYANTIAQLPMAIFVGAFTLPLFPLLASYVKRGEMERMTETLQKGLAYLLILLLPVTAGLILYAEPLVSLVYERGQFGPTATAWTAWGLIFYSLGLYALAGRDLLTRAFYALENTRTPVTIGALGIAVYLLTAWLTLRWLDHGGLALSASVSALAQVVLLFIALWRRIGRCPVNRTFLATCARTAGAAGVMSLAIWQAEAFLGKLPLWLHLSAGIAGAALLYFAVLMVLREPLMKEVLAKLLRRKQGAASGN